MGGTFQTITNITATDGPDNQCGDSNAPLIGGNLLLTMRKNSLYHLPTVRIPQVVLK